MSNNTASQDKLKGTLDQAAGKVKQTAGEAINDQGMANRGTAQQVKGHAEQAWGSVKGAASDVQEQHKAERQEQAHDVREKITSTARNAKENVEQRADDYRHNAR